MSRPTIDWGAGLNNIAVFRALNLGDMLCAVPALRALRRTLPNAHITLIGLDSARTFVNHFRHYTDELVQFPGDPAFPEQEVYERELPRFYRDMRSRKFDLVLQMHGSGQQSNTIVRAMEPVAWAGFVPEQSLGDEGLLMRWPDDLPEIHRYLALLNHLGINDTDDTLELPLHKSDHAQANALINQYALDLQRTVFIHPGARLPSRRWPLERFAAVGSSLAAKGWHITVTGSQNEDSLAHALSHHISYPIKNLCGLTTLGMLGSLLQRGRLLICNDTGISHVAASVNLPSVVIASGSDVKRWAPLDKSVHTVLHTPVACRPCAYYECPFDHFCALGVDVDDVLDEALKHLTEHTAS
ncbi:MAG TPA: LPS biosynthesis glycosyltransferase [Pusillimonas sp.]|jgi:ADP-heptose:LPS heptosyltransferase|nr:LPS biosynthesis glycosyltransferase [Pusillimonas sp.]|tara:strand:+ start:48555 stop:49622 length:1068 start_codon:yes stop_codon:yes gene_type:complete